MSTTNPIPDGEAPNPTISEQRPRMVAVIVLVAALLGLFLIIWAIGATPPIQQTSAPALGPNEQQRLIEVSPQPTVLPVDAADAGI